MVTEQGVQPVQYVSVSAGISAQPIAGEVVQESLACISLNGTELATLMCSPHDLDKLALGFLYNEGIIHSIADIHHLHLSKDGHCADVWLHNLNQEIPQRKIVTAGCGGGVTFDDLSQQHPPLSSTATATPTQLAYLMRQLQLGATLYQRARGIHTAVLAEGEEILLQAEDIGRHNCLDKLCGMALSAGISTHNRIILSSGRISSEMLNKARRLQIPILGSRTSPTSLSVALAHAWNITIVAYIRQDKMRVYTHPERIMGLNLEYPIRSDYDPTHHPNN